MAGVQILALKKPQVKMRLSFHLVNTANKKMKLLGVLLMLEIATIIGNAQETLILLFATTHLWISATEKSWFGVLDYTMIAELYHAQIVVTSITSACPQNWGLCAHMIIAHKVKDVMETCYYIAQTMIHLFPSLWTAVNSAKNAWILSQVHIVSITDLHLVQRKPALAQLSRNVTKVFWPVGIVLS